MNGKDCLHLGEKYFQLAVNHIKESIHTYTISTDGKRHHNIGICLKAQEPEPDSALQVLLSEMPGIITTKNFPREETYQTRHNFTPSELSLKGMISN